MSLSNLYANLYTMICGQHPNQNILHNEWLFLKEIHTDMKELAPSIKGKILDVGCGSMPYKTDKNARADYFLQEDQLWPFPDSEFDAILSFQVIEHVKNLELVQNEVDRVLKSNGVVLLTVPFCTYEHGSPNDYRRFSREGIKQLFPRFEVLNIKTAGGIGSNIGTLFLRWVRISMTRNKTSRIIFAFLMPVWILLTLVTNVFGIIFDAIDGTENLYHNVTILMKKQ